MILQGKEYILTLRHKKPDLRGDPVIFDQPSSAKYLIVLTI